MRYSIRVQKLLWKQSGSSRKCLYDILQLLNLIEVGYGNQKELLYISFIELHELLELQVPFNEKVIGSSIHLNWELLPRLKDLL